MRQICLFLLIFISFSFRIFAQNLDQHFIGTSGDYNEDLNSSLSWSIGEVAVLTITDGTIILTQGFQQETLEVITRIEENALDFSFNVYPNPVSNLLFIECDRDMLKYNIFDVNGNVVLKGSVKGKQTIDLSALNPGIYFLQAAGMKTHKIIKQ